MIKKQDVQHVADLSKIKLEKQEIDNLQKDLSKILSYVEKLKEINVQEAIIENNSTDFTRDDFAEHFPYKQDIINLFPDRKDRFLKVSSVKDSFTLEK